jgi:predicted ribosome quality control (RQC) complex YloA/Tae2 family protein
MSLSDVELAQVVAELGPRLVGGSVGKATERDGHTLLIEVGHDRLVVSVHPRASRVHLATGRDSAPPARPGGQAPRAAARAPAAAGAAASAFAMLLRKRFLGQRLKRLAVLVPGERVLELGFGAGRDRLIAELTGPHANVFVVDAMGLIVASLRPSRSTTRPLGPGDPYAAPPPAPADAKWRGRDRFGLTEAAAQVAAHYEAWLLAEEETRLRERLAVSLRRAVDRLERRERALEGDLSRATQAGAFRKLGDLLLAHLAELPGRGATSVLLADDFEDGAPISVPLEPTLDGKQNAARYYKQGKRLSGGKKRIGERLAATRAQLAALGDQLRGLDGRSLAGLRALEAALPAEAGRGGGPRGGRDLDAEPSERQPYRQFRSSAGDVILVGRGAADNDRLTFGVARGNDLWLHTRDAAGAHVIVRRGGSGSPLSAATLVDAATLAAHHSPLAGEEQVDVSYTQVKNLRKPKGTAPGLVYVSDAKTIRVRVEAERLARLLGDSD